MADDWQKAARKVALKYGVDPDIFIRQVRQESGGNPNARSPANAQGIAQFIPSTAKAYGVDLNDGRIGDDLDGAARYMRDNLKQFGGDYRKALAAYNAGAGAVKKYGGVPPYAETQNYVKRILGNRVPKASAGGGQARGNTSTRTTTTTTTPGVDNSALRQRLLQQYVLERGRPDALLSLGRGLGEARDVPGRTVTKVTGGGSQNPANTGVTGGQRPSGDLVATVQGFDRLAGRYGVPVTAKQEPGHAPGGDHDPAVRDATARDYGGDEASRRRLFNKITKSLGVRGQYGGADINVVKNGIRYQIISRPHGTGPHLHVGMRKA